MLRRHSTKSKSDIHRRKSTTSIRSVPLDHFNVAVAQRDAKLAAVQAYSRGEGRRSADKAVFPPRQPGSLDHSKGEGSPRQQQQISRDDSRTSEHELGRRQSVRFVGPDTSRQTRASRISMQNTGPDPGDTVPFRSTCRSESLQNVGSLRRSTLRDTQSIDLPKRNSSCGKTLVTAPKPALKQVHLHALALDHQQYTPEDDIVSMLPSYRRVRKTRSMFTTRSSVRNGGDNTPDAPLSSTASTAKVNSGVFSNPWPRISFLCRKENDPRPSTPNLKAPNSMSFLRHRLADTSTAAPDQDPPFDSSPILPNPPTQEQQSIRSRILPKTSMFFGANGSKIGHNARKSLRQSSSSAAIPASGTTASLSMSMHGSMRIKARKVSSSIKSRFKSLFVSKSEDDPRMPAQQIEAQRTHVSNFFDNRQFGANESETGAFHERSSLSRVSARLPSLHAVPSSERLRSRRGSIDSLESESRGASDEKSRVTSWASTEVNTVIAHGSQDSSEDWGKQRLSVITEHGLHAPSPSLARTKLSLQTITSQEELAAACIMERLPPGATVDSQRVYSALMKRVNETQQHFADILEHQRKSSDNSDPFRTLSPPTSDDSRDSGGPNAFSHAHPPTDAIQETSRSSSDAASGSYRLGGEVYRSLSPPVQLTTKGAGVPVSKPITDRSSAFFGSPTSHLFRTRSPWRRSLQEAIQKDGDSFQDVDFAAATSATEVTDKKAYSESNYSEDTQIQKSGLKHEFPFAGLGHGGSQHQDVHLFSRPATHRPTGERFASTASSIDWKTRLSLDMERMEHSPPSPTRVTGSPFQVEYVVPTMPRAFGHGHVREEAQIGSCEEDEHSTSPVVRLPTHQTTPLGAIEPNVIKLTPQQRSVIQTTPPAATLLQENTMPTSRTSVCFEDVEGSFVVPKDAMRPRASPLGSTGSCGDIKPIVAGQTQRPAHEAHPIRQARSLAHIQSFSRVRAEETGSPRRLLGSPNTVRLMRRKTAVELPIVGGESAVSTPWGFSAAFERRFGGGTLPRGGDLVAKENQSPGGERICEGGEVIEGGTERGRGSKTMVDMFLNSRRRQRQSVGGRAFV